MTNVFNLKLRVCVHRSGVVNVETHDNVIAAIPGRDLDVARLMAASPELLDALQDMLGAWNDQFGEDACDCQPEPQNQGHVCQCCKARAAIAKATLPV